MHEQGRLVVALAINEMLYTLASDLAVALEAERHGGPGRMSDEALAAALAFLQVMPLFASEPVRPH